MEVGAEGAHKQKETVGVSLLPQSTKTEPGFCP